MSNKNDVSQLNWDAFKYMVFDVPTLKGSYQDRYNHMGI